EAPRALSIAIPAGATATVDVGQPPAMAGDVCGMAVHLIGSGDAGRVYADAYASLRDNPLLVQDVTDSDTIALLNQASTLTQDPNQFDEFELRQLVAQGSLPSLPSAIAPAATSRFTAALAGGLAVNLATADPQIGGMCTAGDPSPLGWVCEPTDKWVV